MCLAEAGAPHFWRERLKEGARHPRQQKKSSTARLQTQLVEWILEQRDHHGSQLPKLVHKAITGDAFHYPAGSQQSQAGVRQGSATSPHAFPGGSSANFVSEITALNLEKLQTSEVRSL